MRNVAVGRVSVWALVAGVMVGALPTRSSGQAGPFQYHALTPCRLVDTRNPAGPSGGPILVHQVPRTFPVQGLCSIPFGAKAVSVNTTAVGPTGGGFITLYPSNVALPLVSNLNYAAGEPALGNGAIVPLAPAAGPSPAPPYDLSVYAYVAGGGTVHMVLDVTGYFQ